MNLRSIASIPFLDGNIDLPICFSTPLSFSHDDKNEFPWLSQKVRYYGIERRIDQGGRSIAYLGFVSDELGNSIPEYENTKIVIKIPNLTTEDTAEDIKEYLNNLNGEGGKEWQLTRARLNKCKYANPIFDLHLQTFLYTELLIIFPITAQIFLSDDVEFIGPLHKYLYKITNENPVENWKGLRDPSIWIELAKCIAIGLADIHERRIVHGEIWPPNIFIKEINGKPQVIFIDFGESFPIEPKGDAIHMQDNVYRAPEKKDTQSIITKASDVYSFGKLLLHLAIGEQTSISRFARGYKRREFVRSKFNENNPSIASKNPFIIDLICNCVSFDPVDRPSISDVLRALNTYVDQQSIANRKPDVSSKLTSLSEAWNRFNKSSGPFLEELIEQKIYEIEEIIKSLSNDVVILNDTRERIIIALIGLFQRLKEGDRFISITSPAMWQSSALGLDGRYFTATELATYRKASIQRAFIFSVEEVGESWASALAEILEKTNKYHPNPCAAELAKLLRLAIKEYLEHPEHRVLGKIELGACIEARNRITLIVNSYVEASKNICKGLFDTSNKYISFESCRGIYLGFLPVGTISLMRVNKAANPVSVFFYNDAEKEEDKYLLMMTDCHARNCNDDISIEKSKPELRGLMVFKSSLGIPRERIKKIEKIFRQSINVGFWIEEFHKLLQEINMLCSDKI